MVTVSQIYRSAREACDLPDGYAFLFAREPNLFGDVVRLDNERRCCGLAGYQIETWVSSRNGRRHFAIPEKTRREIAALHADGVSINQIAKRLGVADGTAWNYTKQSETTPERPDDRES